MTAGIARATDLDPDQVNSVYRTILAESGGMLTVEVFTSGAATEMAQAVLDGAATPWAQSRLRLISKMVASIEAPDSNDLLCLCCPRPVRGTDYRICCVGPDRENSEQLMLFAVCPVCAPGPESVRATIVPALVKQLPGTCALDLQGHEAGHA